MSRTLRAHTLFIAFVAPLLLGGAVATPAAAGLFSFGVGGGVTVPVDNAEHAFDNGVNAHGFVQMNVPFFIQPRLDLSFQKLDIKDVSFATDPGSGAFPEGEQQLFSGLIQGQWGIITAGPVRPYLIVGFGFANMETKLEGGTGTENTSDSATKSVVNGGLGVEVKLGPVRGFAEGRIDNIVNDGELIDLDSIALVPVSFGVVF